MLEEAHVGGTLLFGLDVYLGGEVGPGADVELAALNTQHALYKTLHSMCYEHAGRGRGSGCRLFVTGSSEEQWRR